MSCMIMKIGFVFMILTRAELMQCIFKLFPKIYPGPLYFDFPIELEL
jgi:hypothetical protein